MPIYDYVCLACGRRVEVVHGIHVPGPGSCDACGGAVRKALSMPSIVFKGSGWAKVDARSAGGPSSQPSNEATPGEGSAGDGGTKEAAPKEGTGAKGEAVASDVAGSSSSKSDAAAPKAPAKPAPKAADSSGA